MCLRTILYHSDFFNFAKFNNPRKYSATVQIVDSNEIDNGKILHVLKWDIDKKDTIDEILKKT